LKIEHSPAETAFNLVEQLSDDLDTLGLKDGWLVVFDVRKDRTWESRPWMREVNRAGRRITVLGA
jgi:hypothetical protein